jgi:CspA family cold shock protein
MKGKIVRLIRDRGFGFIRAESGREVFFHRTVVQNTSFDLLKDGESVEFEVGTDPRSGRDRAVNVQVTE